jgi:hypothetical protein
MNRLTPIEGAILDNQLNLEWHPESFEVSSHQAAVDKVASLGDDWRLPTVDELASLVDRTRAKPACDPVLNMPYSDWHWSSSPVVGWPELAWVVFFNFGGVYSSGRNSSGFVRPVRAARPRQ